MGNRGEKKTEMWDKQMMNIWNRKVRSGYTRKQQNYYWKKLQWQGFCAVLNTVCGLFLRTVSPAFSFDHRNILHYVYHKHSCLIRTYLTWNSDVCFTMKSVLTYLCFPNTCSTVGNLKSCLSGCWRLYAPPRLLESISNLFLSLSFGF